MSMIFEDDQDRFTQSVIFVAVVVVAALHRTVSQRTRDARAGES